MNRQRFYPCNIQEKRACKTCVKGRKPCMRNTFSNTHAPLWEKSHIVRSFIVTTEFKE